MRAGAGTGIWDEMIECGDLKEKSGVSREGAGAGWEGEEDGLRGMRSTTLRGCMKMA